MHTVKELKCNQNLDELGKIWLAIAQMNTDQLHMLLKDDMEYEDVSKIDFIALLNRDFEVFKEAGDTELFIDLDTCQFCHMGESVVKFIGNSSRHSIALYFQIEKGMIKDIYHCSSYGCLEN